MTADDIRRLLRRDLDAATMRAAERNERVAFHALRYLVDRGTIRLLLRTDR